MKDIPKILAQTNVIVFFYMDGCPYCVRTQPFWNQLKKTKMGKKYKFAEIESAELPPGLREQKGISGFPHFIARTDGQELSSPGSKTSLKELMDALHLRRSLGRRNTRRLTRRVRKTV
jgi:thioredoxin-like negative regulator of GroEL